MNDLGTALRELAGEAVAPGPADSEGLWRRGRARAVRRQVVVGVIVAVGAAVVVGLGTFAGLPRAEVSPASGRHAPAVPRNIWPAPSWLPSTAEGPPGTVAAIGVPANGKGRFVISAETGKYSLLALPDYVDSDSEQQLQLAPDGNHIAYWYSVRSGPAFARRHWPTGLAVYDTRDGSVRRFEVPVPRGERFQPYGTQSMMWFDADTIQFVGDVGFPNGSGTDRSYVWHLRQNAPSPVASVPTMANIGPPNGQGRVLGRINERQYGFVSSTGKVERASMITLPGTNSSNYTRLARDGSTVVAESFDLSDDHLVTGRVDERGVVPTLAPLPGPADGKIMGWLEPGLVLVLGSTGADSNHHAFYEMNLSTGERSRIGTADGAGGVDWTDTGGTPFLQLATDLLRRPMVNGVHPPSLDPRIRLAVLAGGSIVFLTAGAGALVWWRRRA